MTEILDLLDEARRSPELAAVLAAPVESMPSFSLSRTLRRDLDRRISKRRVRTISDFLAAVCGPSVPPETQAAIARQTPPLLRARVAPKKPTPAPAPAGLRAEMSNAEITAWMKADPALHDLMSRSAVSVSRLVKAPLPSGVFYYESLARMLVLPSHLPKAALSEITRFAAALPEQIADAKRYAAARVATRTTPPADPILRRAWEHVRAAHSRLQPVAFVPRADLVSASVDEDPPSFVLSEASRRVPFATIDLTCGRFVAHRDGEPLPELNRAGLDYALDVLTAPSEATREMLCRLLGRPSWERNLSAIVRASVGKVAAADEDKREIGWRLRIESGLIIEPVQCRAKRGGGYACRLVKHHEVPDDLLVDEVDEVVFEMTLAARGARTVLFRALEQLIGHPRVFPDAKGAPIPVRRAVFALAMRENADGSFAWVPTMDGEPRDPAVLGEEIGRAWEAGLFVEVGDDAIRIARMPRRIAVTLRTAGMRMTALPAEALPSLIAQIDALGAAVPIDLPARLAGSRIDGDPRWLARLTNADDGLRVQIRARPLPEAVPHVPGEGPAELRAVRGAERVFVHRDLAAEPGLARAAIEGTGLATTSEQTPFQWAFRLDQPGPAARDGAILVVEALEARADRFQIEWSGPMVRVAPPLRKVRVVVGSGRDWFGVSGEAGQGAVSLADLLAAVAEGSAFVQVNGGKWARIADTMREPLAALAATAGGGDGPRIGAVHAPLIDALAAAGVDVEADPTFDASLTRLRASASLDPAVPTELRAELRPYQADGYRWLARLAHWAPGAVLADDMGLGKTVQAIALILARQSAGPTLIVAPTSVVFNWAREIQRFAPSLRVKTYHGGERAAQIAALGPGDVVLTSYGVAQRDAERLSATTFATLIVDEAQAIKNPTALRSRAIHKLNADFRLALTGTPVENSATDLWSVFRAVVPGLLLSYEAFRTRFEAPISRGDASARGALAAIVRPFVLRRTKREVAPELPAKTEIVVDVELTADERVLYERARLLAVAKLADSAGPTARFQVLAALTGLRQLACHPRLHDPTSPVASSKLHTLRRMLADLRQTGHRALVFSQFVEHLNLVEAALREDGLRLRRIDGSTALEARRREVDAFQAGDGDVFLISLKAGGVGLNLTAATYVFHLDPWWNPAAEDQATDRAHRIGQLQPVTVYRLVSRGTIEQSILAMHEDKRTLAADLLSGTTSAAPIDVETMMALLRGGADVPMPVEERPAKRPRAPTRAAGADLAAVPGEYRAAIALELKTTGAPSLPTGRAYAGAVDRLVAWAVARGEADRTALADLAPEFLASDAATKTDRSLGKAGLARLWAMLA